MSLSRRRKENHGKKYFAPVFETNHTLLRYAGAVAKATGPEGASRQKARAKQTLKPLGTGHNAAFAAIQASLAEGERVLKHTVQSLG